MVVPGQTHITQNPSRRVLSSVSEQSAHSCMSILNKHGAVHVRLLSVAGTIALLVDLSPRDCVHVLSSMSEDIVCACFLAARGLQKPLAV